jgi:hypothetical protein
VGSHWSSEALHRDGSFGVQARLISTVGILGSARSCTFGKTTTFNNELLSYFTWHKSRDKIRRPWALRGARSRTGLWDQSSLGSNRQLGPTRGVLANQVKTNPPIGHVLATVEQASGKSRLLK